MVFLAPPGGWYQQHESVCVFATEYLNIVDECFWVGGWKGGGAV